MSAVPSTAPTPPTVKAVSLAPESGTVPDDRATASAPQRQIIRIFAFRDQSSWTPEAVAGVVFGILMFLLGVVALWQTRNRKLVFVGGRNCHLQSSGCSSLAHIRADIKSHLRLHPVPAAPIIQTDPDLWIPPYEPPRDFVCIADPPESYSTASILALGGEGPKKPPPKPKPSPQPPQPRDGYDLEAGLTDILLETKSNDVGSLGGQGLSNPKPKPKPKPEPKPPQPRDGYELEVDLTEILLETKSTDVCFLGGQKLSNPKPNPEPKPEPMPKPPQPRDGYSGSFSTMITSEEMKGDEAWTLGGVGAEKPKPKPGPKPPQTVDGYHVEHQALVLLRDNLYQALHGSLTGMRAVSLPYYC